MQNNTEMDSFGEETSTSGQPPRGEASHGPAEQAGALTDEPSAWGMSRIPGLPRFVFYAEFHRL